MNIFLKSVLISILWMITANTVADDHASDSNPAVAMQVHYCSLKEGKDMASVNKALSTWRKWKKETNYNGWTAELTPMFDIRDNYDFYWLNFAPFDYMAEVLKEYEIIIREDTRRSLKLLNHLKMKKKLISYHLYNEKKQISKIIKYINDGKIY